MNYNELNHHRRDDLLAFDADTHKYTVAGVEYGSVTELVEDCFEKFDAEYWAERKATPQCPAHVLLAQWEERGKDARDRGTRLHDRIERHYLGLPDLPDDGDRAFALFRDFAACRSLAPYRSEWRIFYEDCHLAGTLDFLAVTPEGKLQLWDWKRSNKVCDDDGQPVTDNRWRKRAFAPLASIPDTTFFHYALQLSIYRFILAEKYGIEVESAHLGVFHPDNASWWVVDVPYLRDEVITLLSHVAASRV